ncbi:hypothetical protein HTVC104P_gp65 [Pelagibacter phage HTVC104P]|nr:hypothetical protein HTVC104P_gp65 [Pelagibacter phage HTVC104P]
MASTYLSRTTSTPTNDKIMTFSFWLKKEVEQVPIMSRHVDSNNRFQFYNLDSTSKIQLYQAASSTVEIQLNHPRALRDFSGWYHYVIAIDTTQATDSNRVKIYINGELLSGYSTATYPAQNADILFNGSSVVQEIGRTNASDYYRGSMSHFHFIDGTQYAASDFGETDSTTGIWKPKTAPSVTYGNNGFFLKFENSASMGTDSSGNGNNFTVNGTMTQLIDTPSNVFATLNPLDKGYVGTMNTSNGNTTLDSASGSSDYGMRSTLAASSGKYYWETKIPNYGGGAGGNTMMVMDASIYVQMNMQGGSPRAGSWGIQRYDDTKTNLFEDGTFISQNTAMWGGFTSSDIIGIALDCDNGKIYFSKNGVFKDRNGNTGDPANGTNPTFTGLDTSKFYTFYTENRANLDNGTNVNFGNGYFGTTAVSSAQNPDDGIGIFEYDVPTGYRALCTKSINAEEYS